MFKIIGIIVGVAIVSFLVFVATKPNKFRVQRSVVVKAAPEKIFPLITDFHNWAAWSPFDKMDPAMKKTYSGAASGLGSTYSWLGNSRAGQGRMEIIEVTAPTRVAISLAFEKPMKSHNTAEFSLEPQGDSTRVTWAMYGPQSYMMKVMGTVFNMDKMLGKEFNSGLTALKAVAER